MTTKPYDVNAIRARFPSLANTLPDGRPIAFLDGPAGTQVPQAVIDAYADFFLRANANNGGLFSTSRAQGEVEDAAHRAAEDLLNAPKESVKFGANMSTLNFQLSRSLARELKAGDEVIVTQLDHDANYSPWLWLAEDFGNPASTTHVYGQRAREAVELAREQVAALVNADPFLRRGLLLELNEREGDLIFYGDAQRGEPPYKGMW